MLQTTLRKDPDLIGASLGIDSSAAADFRQADRNSDGVIDEHEFLQWHLANKFQGLSPPKLSMAADGDPEAPPTSLQLRQLSIKAFVPFVAFGFLDNAIMTIAGDQIDAALGVTFGLSAMMCAGLGNLLSDVIGIGAGGMIENAAAKLGMPDPKLSAAQQAMPEAQRASLAASALGIAIGCLLGLTPLLMMEDSDTRTLRLTFQSIDTDGNGTITIGELENALHKMGVEFDRKTMASIFSEMCACGREMATAPTPRWGADCPDSPSHSFMTRVVFVLLVLCVYVYRSDEDRSRALSFAEFKELAERWKQLAAGG